jgi:hypothetical protein
MSDGLHSTIPHDSVSAHGVTSRLAILAVLILLAAAMGMIVGCTPMKLYRPVYTKVCSSADPEREYQSCALQEHKGDNGADYLLGFIEFDDQGQLLDRKQMEAVIGAIKREAEQSDQDYLNVVFVHGWHHNAAPSDDNVQVLGTVLQQLAATERIGRVEAQAKPRKLIGVYIGWRGESISTWGIQQATFWDRKNTAHKVGHGDVTEVLNRLECIRQSKNFRRSGPRGESQLVVVGHSFGGAVVYSALSQILVERLVRPESRTDTSGTVEGFGNLVVLINPAFEAQLYSSLGDLSTEKDRYEHSQLPVLVEMTSEADTATGFWFPLGRRFSTLFEKEHVVERTNGATKHTEQIDQKELNLRTVGHFEPYRTHDLRPRASAAPPVTPRSRVQSFANVAEDWESDGPGKEIQFPGTVLTRTGSSVGQNPYLIIRVDPALIPSHDDITDPRVIEFVTQMILVSSQSHDYDVRRERRQRVRESRSQETSW